MSANMEATTKEKISTVYRAAIGLAVSAITAMVTMIYGIAKDTRSEVTKTSTVMFALMEYRIPQIEANAARSDREWTRQLENLERRLLQMREMSDAGGSEMAKIRTEIALIKQKLSIAP